MVSVVERKKGGDVCEIRKQVEGVGEVEQVGCGVGEEG